MRKLLAVYNIAGISGNDGPRCPYYIDAIRSILSQDITDKWGADFKVALSGCCSSDGVQRGLEDLFGDTLTYNWTEHPYPLSVTFNDTVDQCVKHFGEFDGYLYIDSGINFWDPMRRYDALGTLWDIHKSGPNAITAAFPSNDDGSSWWGIKYTPDEDYVFKVGQATNMHVQIFSEEWRKAYGRILPDIFADHTMESTFSVMAAAIKRRYMITQKVHLLHLHSMDGASSGARDKQGHEDYTSSSDFTPAVLLYKTKKDMDARYREGYQLGFSYEQCKPYWPHNDQYFDADGYVLNDNLAPFMRQELFLKSEEFDYNSIRHMFIPGRKD